MGRKGESKGEGGGRRKGQVKMWKERERKRWKKEGGEGERMCCGQLSREIGSGCRNILQHVAIVQMQQDVIAAELCFIGTVQTLKRGEGQDRCV